MKLKNPFRRKKVEQPQPPRDAHQPATFGDVYAVEAFLAPFAREEVKACKMNTGDLVVAGMRCPPSLNSLTIGELIDLSELNGDSLHIFKSAAKILFKLDDKMVADAKIMTLPAPRVYGFVNFIRGELERIRDLFDSIKSEPSAEEMDAGINRLNFGMFGLLDCYALRMRITSHEEAARTPWLNVFAALRIDNATREYKKRLNEILTKRAAEKRR